MQAARTVGEEEAVILDPLEVVEVVEQARGEQFEGSWEEAGAAAGLLLEAEAEVVEREKDCDSAEQAVPRPSVLPGQEEPRIDLKQNHPRAL